MFDDILVKERKRNRKIICPECGDVVISIEDTFDDGDWEIEKWEHKCKQCSEKIIKCSGGCGKEGNFKKTRVSLIVKWTCKECCDKEWDKYD